MQADGVTIPVRVTPRARKPGLSGRVDAADGPRLAIGVTDPPEDGRANKAVCATLAKALGVPASAVTVAQGASSRLKLLRVAGDPATIAARLEPLA